MCTGRDLAAGVVRARLPYAKRLVSGNLVRARLDVCVRIVPVCGVRGCDVGARQGPGERHGCVEAVHGVAGGRRALVGSPLRRRSSVGTVCGRARGGLVDSVSSQCAGSGMRGRLGWCGVRWLFQGCCVGRRLGHGAAAAWGAGTLRKGS